jgi:hypothetical protein
VIRGQRYTDRRARQRLATGRCPECGHQPWRHDGGGGPGCSLTDNGVALRLAVYAEEQRASGSP